ncbi:hypothetical protein BH23GEM9_BH23GEM9_23210 [soil metagenome]
MPDPTASAESPAATAERAASPLRIGYLYPFRAHPPRGGNHLHAWQLIRAFHAAGHDVVTLGDDSIPGVRSTPATETGVAELLRTIDVLYVRVDGNDLSATPLIVSAMERSPVPVVWEINAAADERLAYSWLGGHRPPPRNGFGRFVDRTRRRVHAARQAGRIEAEERLRRRLARSAAAAVCVSSAVGAYAVEDLRIPSVEVIPNGSDPELNHPGRSPVALPAHFRDRLKVLYAGSPMYPWQGFDLIARTIELHRSSGDGLAFIFLLNQRAGAVPEGDDVVVFDAVPYEQVGSHIAAADVCLSIHPEHFWDPRGFHGSPTKLFDYMACGRPVLASRVGQLAEVIRHGENGALCDNTPEDILSKLRWLAARRERLPAMGAIAREDVLIRYNWSSIATATVTLFRQVRTA